MLESLLKCEGKMYRSILYAHNGSPSADRAVAHAAALAVAADAEVVVLHVIRPIGQQMTQLSPDSGWLPAPPAAVEAVQDVVAYERAQALQQLRRAATRFEQLGVHSVRPVVVEGLPDEAIVSIAEREGCDLIIIGTRAQSGFRRVLSSSVAEGVVSRSRRPVLLIGPTAFSRNDPPQQQCAA